MSEGYRSVDELEGRETMAESDKIKVLLWLDYGGFYVPAAVHAVLDMDPHDDLETWEEETSLETVRSSAALIEAIESVGWDKMPSGLALVEVPCLPNTSWSIGNCDGYEHIEINYRVIAPWSDDEEAEKA